MVCGRCRWGRRCKPAAQPERGSFGDDGVIITNVFLNVNMYVIIFVKIKKH